MEQSRLFLAIVLSFVVFLGWELFFSEKKDHQAPREAPTASAIQGDVKEETISPSEITSGDRLSLEMTMRHDSISASHIVPKTITVHTPKYSAQISEKGAVFTHFTLADYREQIEKNAPLKEMIPQNIPDGSVRTGFIRSDILENALFNSGIETDVVNVHRSEESISFHWSSSEGIYVEKRFTFSPDTYLVLLEVIVKNQSAHAFKDDLFVMLAGKNPEEAKFYGFQGPSALIDNQVEQIKVKKIAEKSDYAGQIKWIALKDRYFISSIIPKESQLGRMHLNLKNKEIIESSFIQPLKEIAPGFQDSKEYHLFFGPKSMKILRGLDNDLDRVIKFGWFDFIAKPCLWFMNFIYGFIPNYGIAIIVLTIVTKIILWPLGNKSYKSMNEMKKIQPLMAEIREKYKSDKKKMNEELMKLYRVYKINPLGGCLPMVVQIPVFIALYRMLDEAIELRHAPFMLWINDLSAPDRLFRFDFSIPFMQPPHGIPVLTLIMGATMLLQQKMSPAPGDPAQAKMMMFMPIIFTFIFINFSSGLVLYWLVNNILSIAQQYYTSKKTA